MCTCVCLFIYIYISFFSLLFNDRIIVLKKVCELIVNLWNDTGNDHTGGSDIFMSLCIINLNSLLIIPSCTRKQSLSCHHQWLVGPSIILPTRNAFKWWIFNSWIWLLLTRENCPNTAVFHKKNQMSVNSKIVFPYFVSIVVQNNENQKRDRILK
jgi:hypothetical protein